MLYITLDVWDGNFAAFHAFCRSPSRYGNFPQPFLSHHMAERVIEDTLWYRAARADPKAHMPRLHKWMATPRIRAFASAMTGEKKARFEAMGGAWLRAAEDSHLKWNGVKWIWVGNLGFKTD